MQREDIRSLYGNESFQLNSDIIEKKKASFKPHARFTPEEDDVLYSLVTSRCIIDWLEIAQMMPGRNPRQCRERWTNYLSPTLNTSQWTSLEDEMLREKVKQLGKKWVKISKFFNNRTDQMCKNRYNILERKDINAKRGRRPGSTKSINKNKENNDEQITTQNPQALTGSKSDQLLVSIDQSFCFSTEDDFLIQNLEDCSEIDEDNFFLLY